MNSQPAYADRNVDVFYSDLKRFFLMDHPGSRRSERINVTIPVIVSSLDEQDGCPAVTHYAISRDLSNEGIGLVMSNPVGREIVLLSIQPPNGAMFDIQARVIHCEEIGYYHHVGLEFIID